MPVYHADYTSQGIGTELHHDLSTDLARLRYNAACVSACACMSNNEQLGEPLTRTN